MQNRQPPPCGPDGYTIAWVCALHVEMAAACAMLDETYSGSQRQAHDSNTYTLGSIKGHNVVIACLPTAKYGTNSAANVLTHLTRTFPSIRFCLIVGVGGGVPSKADDIRLGDIVVGTKMIQHDFGKHIGETMIQVTGVPKMLHTSLGTAVSALRSSHELVASQVPSILRDKMQNHVGYSRPPSSSDNLFEADYDHISEALDCCGACDHFKIMPRTRRISNDPNIHYGAIGSGNQVIRNGITRDELARQLNVLCFEMETAGLMDILPCLPIRGICDYSDSHKNKEWQRYAAATAAAYARELLEVLPVVDAHAHAHANNSQFIIQKRHFMVPFGRNRNFVGRESILDQLLHTVPPDADDSDCQRIAIGGLGGMGKTQIALELVFRIRDKYPGCSIFWIPAQDAASFENAYRNIGQSLMVDGISHDNADVGLLVKRALSESNRSWILIIDNADDEELLFDSSSRTALSSCLPFNRRGSILFTTRNHQIAVRLDIPANNSFIIGEMSRDESIQMLQNGIFKESSAQDRRKANDLLDFLTDLPLAIKQASAYMAKTGISISRYLEYCTSGDQGLIKLLSKDFEDRGRYDNIMNPVATTWLLSFEHISRDNKRAAEYLRFLCFLGDKNIPFSLLPPPPPPTDGKYGKDGKDGDSGGGEMMRDEAIGILKAYAFVNEGTEAGMLDIHRLVRLAMRNWLENEKLVNKYFTTVLRRLVDVFPPPTHENKDTWLDYLPHAQSALDLGPAIEANEANIKLLSKIGVCFTLIGQYKQAERMHLTSLGLRQKSLGSKHPLTLNSMNSVANSLQFQGNLHDAEQIQRQTLDLRRETLGQEHSDTLSSMNNLALLLALKGHHEPAEQLHRQTLELRQRVLGKQHPDTLASMNNLALLLLSRKRYREAERIYEQTVRLMEKVHGQEHPNTLISLNNLANTLQLQDKNEEAYEKHQEALDLQKKVLGQNHPDTLSSMNNLALLLVRCGDYDEAQQLYRRTLRLRENLLGKGHPDTIASRKNLDYVEQHISGSTSITTKQVDTGDRRAYSYVPSLSSPCSGYNDIYKQRAHDSSYSTSGYQYSPNKHSPDYQGYSQARLSQHNHGSPTGIRSLLKLTGLSQPNAAAPSQSRVSAPPPSAPQHFGQGAPSDYSFQYSQCTGRRKALLIGINYLSQRGQLRGCINDVRNMMSYLSEHLEFRREDMVILTDDQQNPMSQPTKQNILRAMHWLVKEARTNDSLFFHYCGHGGQTKDLDGDEPDGYDEVIYPVDFRQRGHITDDEMHRIMVQPLTAGVRLTAIFDSCHSGTALDLPYIYSTQGILKEPNLAKEAGQGLLGVISSYSRSNLGGVASNIGKLFKKKTSGDDAYTHAIATKTSPADVIMLSGSKDDQTSSDATIASQATGAMSWAFVNALHKNPKQSYVQLLNSIRDELSTRYTQKPQLSCSHPLDTTLLFVI